MSKVPFIGIYTEEEIEAYLKKSIQKDPLIEPHKWHTETQVRSRFKRLDALRGNTFREDFGDGLPGDKARAARHLSCAKPNGVMKPNAVKLNGVHVHVRVKRDRVKRGGSSRSSPSTPVKSLVKSKKTVDGRWLEAVAPSDTETEAGEDEEAEK